MKVASIVFMLSFIIGWAEYKLAPYWKKEESKRQLIALVCIGIPLIFVVGWIQPVGS